MPPGSLPPPLLQPPPSSPGFCPYSPSSPSSPLLGGGLCRSWPRGIRLLPGIRTLFPPWPPAPNRNCTPIALKLLSPSLPPAGTARHPYPGHSVLPTLCPQQRRPAPAYSRCSVRIGQMVNSRDRRWGDAWERRGRCVRVSAILSPHLAMKAALCRKYLELTLRCPNF